MRPRGTAVEFFGVIAGVKEEQQTITTRTYISQLPLLFNTTYNMAEAEYDPRLEELNQREKQDSTIITAIGITVITFGILGNIVAFVFYGFKEKHTITNLMIAVLALNDFVLNMVFFDEIYVYLEPFKFTNLTGCKMMYAINYWLLMNSVSLMLVIAIERYRKICHPFTWQFTHASAKVTTVGVTLATLVICSKEIFFAEIVPEDIRMNDNSTVVGYVCVHSHDKHLKPFIKASNFMSMTIFFVLFASIIIIYSLIVHRLCKINKKSMTNKKNKNKLFAIGDSAEDISNERYTTVVEGVVDSKDIIKETDISVDTSKMNGPININENIYVTKMEKHTHGDKVGNSADTEKGQATSDVKFGNGLVAEKPQDETSSNNHRHNHSTSMKSNLQNRLVQAERKVTKMIIVVAIVSILSFVPYFIVILLIPSHHSTENQLSNTKKKILRESYKLNGVLNPYIMCVCNPSFRQFIKSFFSRCFDKR